MKFPSWASDEGAELAQRNESSLAADMRTHHNQVLFGGTHDGRPSAKNLHIREALKCGRAGRKCGLFFVIFPLDGRDGLGARLSNDNG